MVIIEIMQTGIRIDISHIAEQFLDAGERDTIADSFAEYGSHIVPVGIIDGREIVTVIAYNNVYAINAIDVVIDIFSIGIAINVSDCALDKLAVSIDKVFYLGN